MVLSDLHRTQLAPILADPVLFSKGVLGDRPWKLQREIMASVAANPLTAVKACHASGKTHCAANVAIWWLLRWKNAKVITTAPTWRQVKLMWAEIGDRLKASKLPLPEPNATGIRFSDQHYAIGISTNDPTKFQGYHGEHVLIIVDEATGVLASIFEAIEGIRAGGDVRVLLLGNPTVPDGKFYEAFTKDRGIWKLFTISAFATPNFTGVTESDLIAMDDDELGLARTPFLVTRRWVRERYERWGPGNAMYRSRVLGEFPTQSEQSVFSLAWIERASHEPDPLPTDGKRRVIQVGIDVAGPGEDETVLYARVGGVIIRMKAWAQPDPRGEVVAELHKLRLDFPGCVLGPVVVDTVGIGWYMARHLLDHGFDVYGFVAGGAPRNPEQFRNQKAEAYWSLREWMEHLGMAGLEDEETQAQLSGIRYHHTAAGQIEIESKEKAKKRGATSPDRAEGLVLAFVPPQPKDQHINFTSPVNISPI